MTGARAQAAYAERRKAEDPAKWQADMREREGRFRMRHPEKKAAWNAVYRAICSGRLVRPTACDHCGTSCKPEASHDDYSRQLDVEWLCHPCHTAKDVQLRKGSMTDG